LELAVFDWMVIFELALHVTITAFPELAEFRFWFLITKVRAS